MKGHLYAHRNLPAPTKTHLKERLKRLQDLATQSLFGRDNMYKDNVDDYKKDGVWKSLNIFVILMYRIIVIMANVSRMADG